MIRIAVLVSGGGTNLQALIDAQMRCTIKQGKLAAVISSSPDAFALQRAKTAGIPGYVVNRRDYPSNEAMTFMYVLTEELISAYPNAIINVHPALIPSFCGEGAYGLHVHEQALTYGVKLSGATVHFVNEQCDGGPIILQKAVAVEEDDTPQTLQRRIMEQAEWKLLPKAVSLFCEGRLKVEGRLVKILPGV